MTAPTSTFRSDVSFLPVILSLRDLPLHPRLNSPAAALPVLNHQFNN
jgi:hypothetical protein